MTDRDDDRAPEGRSPGRSQRESDDALLAELASALTARGELLPTDEDDVRDAEDAGVEKVPLPATLERPPGEATEHRAGVVDIATPRRSRARTVVSHAAALLLGAAAAATLTIDRGDDTPPDLRSDPATSSTAAPAPPIRLEIPRGCDACCAGVDCPRAARDLATCPSGRRCVTCDTESLATSRYRLRIGAVVPSDHGRETMKRFPQGEPELCLRIGASPETCGPTLLGDGERWTTQPLVAAAGDLAAQVSLRLRWKGVREPLATAARWSSPVAVTPSSLCKGYAARLETDEGEPFGAVSLFLDDTHFVEVARAADVETLRAHRSRFVVEGVTLAIHETTATTEERFALALGPFDRPTAERIRWQLLEQHQQANPSFGADYRGEARPLR